MSIEDVKKIAENLAGKKARVKSLDQIPSETKSVKLPREVQKGLEEHFSTKLSKVRVHVGPQATQACKDLKVQAFTHGSDIFLRKPADAKNKDLLAHELTHTVQQGGGRVPKPRDSKVLTTK